MTLDPRLRRLLSLGIVAAALVFLGLTVERNWAELRGYEWRVQPSLLALSVVAHLAVLAFGVFVWQRVLHRFATPPTRYPALLRIWSLSNVARYIPGTVWQFLAAAELARERGLPRVLLVSSLLVHMGFVLLAAGVVSVATLPLAALGLGRVPLAAALGVLPLLLLLVHPRVLNTALSLVNRVARREALRWQGSWMDGVALLALAVVSWLLYGGAFWLFLRSVAPFPPATLLPAAGINAASFAAGWLAVLAPSGLGVREGAMTALLTPYVPLGVAAAIAILARLWAVLTEAVLVAGALTLPRWLDRRARRR